MLNIYHGEGFADKERFIFENIDPHRKTILIVPDQFSLQAERDAFRFMGAESLTDLMIVDFSALGNKVVKEVEGRDPEIIDKYGRHMLLTVLIDDLADQLETYGNFKGRNSFIDHVNTMISELKRYEIGVEELEDVLSRLKDRGGKEGYDQAYLTMKLSDILRIYQNYEEAVAGLYHDSEDYITYYAERIPRSQIVSGARVWIYGFDTFTPRNLTVIKQLLTAAEEVSVVLTGDGGNQGAGDADPVRKLTINDGETLFNITETVTQRLEALADEAGVGHSRYAIERKYDNLWNAYSSCLDERITLVQTTDHHHEAERAAAYIQQLVRDEGYRYGEIAVICNDADELGGMLNRALQRIGVPVFSDRRRSVLHQPVVSFLLSFLDVIQKGYGGAGMIGMIKSGLLDFDQHQENLMENYIREFGIRSTRWKEPFKYRSDRYSDEDLDVLNEMRAFLVDTCEKARDSIGRRNTAEEKVRGLYSFLDEDLGIRERIEETVKRQREMGLEEGASETTQIWNAICRIFDQIIRVLGERKISNQTLTETIRAGLSMLEVGLVPYSSDSLLMGTMQRTRPGQIRALVIVGAEDGLLPLHGGEKGLLTRRELSVLEEMDLELARREAVSAQEEQLAIYRMCSLPRERLYVSCSQTGSGATVARPSSLFEKLTAYQPRVERDLEKSDMMESVVEKRMTISYLAQSIRDRKRHQSVDPRWDQVGRWYEKEDPQALKRIGRAAGFDNKMETLGRELADALFVGDREALTVSASRLELYGGCPFAHFIQYGLRPVEQRLFEVGGREIGDVYHDCIMKYCEELKKSRAAGGTGWDEISKEECGEMIRRIMKEEEKYREGLFRSDEANLFRMERVTEICTDIAWAVTEQIRQGRIHHMSFEESFGYGEDLPAMEFDLDGRKARVVGRIDRVDLMGDEETPSVRIIDYKTGGNEIDPEEMRQGYQLQLAVYMEAVRQGLRDKGNVTGAGDGAELKPAGVFYFKIREFIKEIETGKEVEDENIEKEMKKGYRLEGISVSDPEILSHMDRELLPESKYESMVVPVKYEPNKEAFTPAGGGILMSPEEFSKLMEESRKHAEDICRRMYDGGIKADPRDTGKKNQWGDEITACTYCDFGSICVYEGH